MASPMQRALTGSTSNLSERQAKTALKETTNALDKAEKTAERWKKRFMDMSESSSKVGKMIGCLGVTQASLATGSLAEGWAGEKYAKWVDAGRLVLGSVGVGAGITQTVRDGAGASVLAAAGSGFLGSVVAKYSRKAGETLAAKRAASAAAEVQLVQGMSGHPVPPHAALPEFLPDGGQRDIVLTPSSRDAERVRRRRRRRD